MNNDFKPSGICICKSDGFFPTASNPSRTGPPHTRRRLIGPGDRGLRWRRPRLGAPEPNAQFDLLYFPGHGRRRGDIHSGSRPYKAGGRGRGRKTPQKVVRRRNGRSRFLISSWRWRRLGSSPPPSRPSLPLLSPPPTPPPPSPPPPPPPLKRYEIPCPYRMIVNREVK